MKVSHRATHITRIRPKVKAGTEEAKADSGGHILAAVGSDFQRMWPKSRSVGRTPCWEWPQHWMSAEAADSEDCCLGSYVVRPVGRRRHPVDMPNATVVQKHAKVSFRSNFSL